MTLAELQGARQYAGKYRFSGPGRADEPGIVPLFGGIMIIEIAVPDDWTTGQVLAMRQVRSAQPVIGLVRADVTPEQLRDIYNRIDAMIRESGLAVEDARAS
jgi:hypothetical protein